MAQKEGSNLNYSCIRREQVVKVNKGIRVYPHTALARIALADGVISEDDNLLQPRFYLAEGLED